MMQRILAALAGLTIAGSAWAQSTQERDWPNLEKAARDTTVTIAMWGGSANVNAYIDEYVAERVAARYGIVLERVPLSDTGDAVNKLLAEKAAGGGEGSIDLIWVNGENFASGREAGLWFGPWARNLPNAEYIDWDSPTINRDFGTPVAGMEAPWSRAQFVMIYDSAAVEEPPRTPAALKAWAAAHPGRFTYPAPPDFTGTAFVEQMLVALTGGPEPFQQAYEKARFADLTDPLWRYLNAIEPDLWRGGATYPNSLQRLNKLYADGVVDFTMNYNSRFAQRQVDKGMFPASTRTYVFDSGTLSNTSYMAIPFNAPNKAGAQVVANVMQSPAAQARKQNPEVLGYLSVLDVGELPAPKQAAFDFPLGKAAIPAEKLAENRLPEANSSWIMPLQEAWRSQVAR